MGEIDGDIVAPRVAIEEGAYVRGSVEMQRKVLAVAAGVVAATLAGLIPATVHRGPGATAGCAVALGPAADGRWRVAVER